MKNKLLEVANICYSGNVTEGIAKMVSVIPDIQQFSASIDDEQLVNKLMTDALLPMLSAMEQGDGVELADRITYELIPLIDKV